MCWHEWTNWEQFDWVGRVQRKRGAEEMIPCSERRQKRHCIKCNKEEDELV